MSNLDDWFRRRTFHASAFDPPEELVRLKDGRRISLAIPARNEALTVGPIVSAIRTTLMERFPLVDELVVIDGGSTDGTPSVATGAGADVVDQGDVLPSFGAGGGKGAALWKSLFVTEGDLVVWVDADIRNFHPRFVSGLVGPLLRSPDIAFVKAFYERPIADSGRVRPTGGGRVTELVARPLINLFWPELAGLVQPLSGEYAGRRSLLEQIPFATGYGVELAMLIDVASHAGADAIGQVDLETRVHRNQGLPALSRMAFGILQAGLSRLERSGRGSLRDEPAKIIRQFRKTRGGEYEMVPSEIICTDLPPILTVPEYRNRAR